MFYSCKSLQTVPLFNTALGTNFSLMFSGCSSLQTVPLLNVSNSTTFTDTFKQCPNLKSATLNATTNPNGRSFSYLNCALSAAELNRIFTNLGEGIPPTVDPNTGVSTYLSKIIITGNWGASQCNVSIANAKNYEVIP